MASSQRLPTPQSREERKASDMQLDRDVASARSAESPAVRMDKLGEHLEAIEFRADSGLFDQAHAEADIASLKSITQPARKHVAGVQMWNNANVSEHANDRSMYRATLRKDLEVAAYVEQTVRASDYEIDEFEAGKLGPKITEFETGQLSRIETAATWIATQAQAQAQSDVQYYQEQSPDSSEALFHARDMGLNARGSAEYRKELEKFPSAAAVAKQALVIGNPMPKADWAQAKEIVGGQAGKLYLPKIHTDYAGKIVMVTDTHIVQQVGKNTVMAHDLSRMENSRELKDLNAAGQLQGKQLKVSYGAVMGKQEVMTFSQVRAAEVSKTAKEYAEANIKTPKAREAFLQHVDKMMAKEIEQSKTLNKSAPPAPIQRKDLAPTR